MKDNNTCIENRILLHRKSVCYTGMLVLVLVMLLSVVTGCRKTVVTEDEELSEGQIYVYYSSEDNLSLTKEKMDLPDNARFTLDYVDAAIKAMKNPKESGNVSVISPLSEPINYLVMDSILYVYFYENYYEMLVSDEVMFRSAFVMTMTQLEGVKYVYFQINDKPVVDAGGNPISLMKGSDFVDDTGNGTYRTWVEVSLYYASETTDKLIKQNVTIGYGKKASVERAIIEQLIAGPSAEESEQEGLYRSVPDKVELISTSTYQGTCYVNFDASFAETNLSVTPAVTIYSIVNSLCELSTVNRVQISINGKSNVFYKDAIDLTNPLERNLDIIEAENVTN